MTAVSTVLTLTLMAVATATAIGVFEVEKRKVDLRGDVLDLAIEAQSQYLERCGTITSPVQLSAGQWQTPIEIDYGTPGNWSVVIQRFGAVVRFTSTDAQQRAYVAATIGGVVSGNTVDIEVSTPDLSDVPALIDFKRYSLGIDHCNA